VTASATAAHDAGAPKPKPTASAGAGAPDAGAAAAADAGAASPGAQIAQQVDAIFTGKKTFSARFKQTYTPKFQGPPKESSGVVFVERPNKVSFRYDPPNKQRIVSDGTTIKVYMPDDNQMFETPVQKTQYPGALAFMMGNGIASSFDFKLNDAKGYDGKVLEGKPLTPNPSYESVLFLVGREKLEKKDPGVIERVIIVDAAGNRNRFDFTEATQPATIDPAEFTFTPPPGTNITRQ
jgi:outer membrane lipoprotein carrier protein